MSWKCEQLDSILIWVQNVNLKLDSMISLNVTQFLKSWEYDSWFIRWHINAQTLLMIFMKFMKIMILKMFNESFAYTNKTCCRSSILIANIWSELIWIYISEWFNAVLIILISELKLHQSFTMINVFALTVAKTLRKESFTDSLAWSTSRSKYFEWNAFHFNIKCILSIVNRHKFAKKLTCFKISSLKNLNIAISELMNIDSLASFEKFQLKLKTYDKWNFLDELT